MELSFNEEIPNEKFHFFVQCERNDVNMQLV